MTTPKTAVVKTAEPAATTPADKYLHVFKTEVLIDRAALHNLKTNEVQETLAKAYGLKKPVRIIDDIRGFLSVKSLMKELVEVGPELQILCEHHKIELTDEEYKALKDAIAVRNRVEAVLVGRIPPYLWMDGPIGWTPEVGLRVNQRSGGQGTVRRTSNASYSLSFNALRTLWEVASKLWKNSDPGERIHSSYRHDSFTIRAASTSYYPSIYSDRVIIGCQTVQRYEIEGAAQLLDLPLPA